MINLAKIASYLFKSRRMDAFLIVFVMELFIFFREKGSKCFFLVIMCQFRNFIALHRLGSLFKCIHSCVSIGEWRFSCLFHVLFKAET